MGLHRNVSYTDGGYIAFAEEQLAGYCCKKVVLVSQHPATEITSAYAWQKPQVTDILVTAYHPGTPG